MVKYALDGDLKLPDAWMPIGKVKKLFIYPVKSCKGLKVDSFLTSKHAAESGGLVDRQFMVVDKKGNMLTARKYPNMVLIEVNVEGSFLRLSYPGMEDVSVRVPEINAETNMQSDVFGEKCKGVDMGEEIGNWLSEVILNDEEVGLRLICHPKSSSSRPDKTPNEVSPNMNVDDKPYYADTFAYMMLSTASITGLNKMLEAEDVDLQVEETRFRPNILIDGDFPEFSEDKWPCIKIGDVVFRNVRVCDRCVFTSVDPFMGDKHPQQEPLKTLRKYRSAQDSGEKSVWGSSPFFGVFLSADTLGTISTDDPVSIGSV